MTGEQSELNEILDLSLIADVLQILNFWLNLKQVSSDALMQELKNQDSSYLEGYTYCGPCGKSRPL